MDLEFRLTQTDTIPFILMKTIPNDPRVQKLTLKWSRVTQVYCKSPYISTSLEGNLIHCWYFIKDY